MPIQRRNQELIDLLRTPMTQGARDAGGGGHEIQDEGVALPQQEALDFQGAGVTASNDAVNGKTLVTIPGVTEGPGIDLVGQQVGLGGDLPLVYHADGRPVSEYGTIAEACAAASPGDLVQPQAGTYAENITIPAGVTVRGRGLATVIAGTVTGADGATLKDVYVRVVGDSVDPLYGIKGAGAYFRVLDTYVYVENATGAARAVACVSGGETRCQNVRVGAIGGSEGYGFYQDAGDMFLDHCIARASDCTTAPFRRRG